MQAANFRQNFKLFIKSSITETKGHRPEQGLHHRLRIEPNTTFPCLPTKFNLKEYRQFSCQLYGF